MMLMVPALMRLSPVVTCDIVVAAVLVVIAKFTKRYFLKLIYCLPTCIIFFIIYNLFIYFKCKIPKFKKITKLSANAAVSLS